MWNLKQQFSKSNLPKQKYGNNQKYIIRHNQSRIVKIIKHNTGLTINFFHSKIENNNIDIVQ